MQPTNQTYTPQNPFNNGVNGTTGYYKGGQENGLLPPKNPLSADQTINLGERGQSGTLISGGGFITFEEYNPDLTGRKKLHIYDQMRKSDATVSQSLKAVKQPVLAAQYTIEPASNDPYDEMVAAFIRDNLFDGEINFQSFLREALTMLDFGFSIAEKVYEYDQWAGYEHIEEIKTQVPMELAPMPVDPNNPAPVVPMVPPMQTKITQKVTNFPGGQYVMLKKLAFRRQLTVYRWQTEDQQEGVTQFTYTSGQLSIPGDKLALFTHDQEGDNFEGVSLLRPAYKHWFFKDTLYKIEAIAMERQGVGVPQLTAPEDADEPSKAEARKALKELRSNEKGYIEIPRGYIIDFMDMKGTSVISCADAIEHHDKQIMKNVLAGFLELGKAKGGTGSHALSADQSRLFTQSLESIARKVCEVINDRIIKQLVDYNFNVTKYPTIVSGSLADDNITTLAASLQQLTNADLLTPDPDLEQFIRDTFKLPPLPDEIKENYNNRARSQASTVPDAMPIAQEANPDSDAPDDFPDDKDEIDEVNASEDAAILAQAMKLRRTIGKKIDALSKRP